MRVLSQAIDADASLRVEVKMSRARPQLSRLAMAIGAVASSAVLLGACGGSGGSKTATAKSATGASTTSATNATSATPTSGAPQSSPGSSETSPGVVRASSGEVTATMHAATHRPHVGTRWPIEFVVTRGGKPAKAEVAYEYLFGGQVVAHRSHYKFAGSFHDVFVWPSSAVGYPLTFRAVIGTGGATLDLDYPVQVVG
jgi:hypothetical protein